MVCARELVGFDLDVDDALVAEFGEVLDVEGFGETSVQAVELLDGAL